MRAHHRRDLIEDMIVIALVAAVLVAGVQQAFGTTLAVITAAVAACALIWRYLANRHNT
jgi:hypothetical protein